MSHSGRARGHGNHYARDHVRNLGIRHIHVHAHDSRHGGGDARGYASFQRDQTRSVFHVFRDSN